MYFCVFSFVFCIVFVFVFYLYFLCVSCYLIDIVCICAYSHLYFVFSYLYFQCVSLDLIESQWMMQQCVRRPAPCCSVLPFMRRRRRMMRMRRMEAKSCANISQNLLYCSPRYTSTYIGTRKFLTKPLWVYSHLKSDFFSEKKLLNVI